MKFFKWDLNNLENKSLSDDNDLYADWPNQRCYWINGKDTIEYDRMRTTKH